MEWAGATAPGATLIFESCAANSDGKLSANPTSITSAQTTNLTATVTGGAPRGSTGAPQAIVGSVSSKTASTNLGSYTLAAGTCSVSVSGSALQTGTNSILATYAGGGSYPASTSNAVSVTVTAVQQPTPAVPPTFSPAAGSYTSTQSVTLNDTTSGSSIFYTIDGSAPSTSSTPYTGPIT